MLNVLSKDQVNEIGLFLDGKIRYFAQFDLLYMYNRVMCRRKSRGVRRPLLEVTNTGLLQQQQLEDDSARHQQKKKKTGTEPTVEEPVASATKTRYYRLTPKDLYRTVCAWGSADEIGG
jgi:hypothetical protein